MGVWTAFYQKLDAFEIFFHKKILMPLAFATLLLATLSLSFQVLFRFVLIHFVSFSFPYTDEMTRYLLIATTYLIVPVVIKEGSHPAIDVLRNVLPPTGKYVLYFLIKALMVFCLSVLLYYLVIVIKLNTQYTSPILKAPGPLLYSLPMIGLVTMSFQTLVELLGVITKSVIPFEYPREEEMDYDDEELE